MKNILLEERLKLIKLKDKWKQLKGDITSNCFHFVITTPITLGKFRQYKESLIALYYLNISRPGISGIPSLATAASSASFISEALAIALFKVNTK